MLVKHITYNKWRILQICKIRHMSTNIGFVDTKKNTNVTYLYDTDLIFSELLIDMWLIPLTILLTKV